MLIHGFNRTGGQDCAAGWNKAVTAMRGSGWRGAFVTFGFYTKDTHCTFKHPGSSNTPLGAVGRSLAWDIYNHFSRYGRPVDVMAHSLGGLVIRSALDNVHKKVGGFPPYLYVEDVVTLGTPHQGTVWANFCRAINTQCAQMVPGSKFLRRLGQSPQSATGTDWTLIGSTADEVVSYRSAIGMNAGHKVVYAEGARLSHSALRTTTTGAYPMQYKNYYDGTTHNLARGAPPVIAGKNALYWWWRW